MSKTIFFLFLLSIGLKLSAQELTCADFKTGIFIIPTNDQLIKYTIVNNDSISEFTLERDLTIQKWIVVREENTQIEWKNGIGNEIPEYEIIEWIDDCTYRLTYDDSKSELEDGKKWINSNNGIVVSKLKIEGKCLFYNAEMSTNDGEKLSQEGVICKE